MPPLADSIARARIQEDLATSFIVEASAGTGKTTEIINRVVAVLARGLAEVGRIVVVTFTNKAAGELKLRLRAELERCRQQATELAVRERLDAALSHLEEAQVSTIHSFCNEIVAEHPVEACVDPAFRLVPEPEAEQLHATAFRDWMEERLADPPEALRRVLRRQFWGASATDVLQRDSWAFAEWRDCQTPWKRAPFDRASAIGDLVDTLSVLMDDIQTRPRDNMAWDLRTASELVEYIRQTENVRSRDDDEIEGRLIALLDDYGFMHLRRGGHRQYAQNLLRADLVRRYDELRREIEGFRDRANADLAPLLQAEIFASLLRYEALKRARGILDFGDLLLRTRYVLHENAHVRSELQQRFSHLFIDEFQDTSALQAEILMLLASDDPAISNWREVRPKPGKLFLVGDPKQSIYGFRRADMRTYIAVKEQLAAAGVVPLVLTTSFRALPEIQRFVNGSFAPEMTGDFQPGYVPLDAFRAATTSQPTVIALPIPKPYGKYDVTKTAIRASLPAAIGAFVDWLVNDSGWQVQERGKLVDLAAHHICLIFRNFKSGDEDLTRPYVNALEARDLPHIVVGGRSLHAREEIETLRAALAAIEYPDDELSLYATLRGALFAFTDAELLEYRTNYRLDYTRLPEEVPEYLLPIRATRVQFRTP
jgi:ATP-dependent exoDNAse (exonuclease V) beta subunit